jgi:hypothetical protein
MLRAVLELYFEVIYIQMLLAEMKVFEFDNSLVYLYLESRTGFVQTVEPERNVPMVFEVEGIGVKGVEKGEVVQRCWFEVGLLCRHSENPDSV